MNQARQSGTRARDVRRPPVEYTPPVVYGRVPPNNLDAEAAVLSASLLDQTALERASFLRPEHFYSQANQQVWAAVLTVRAAGGEVDLVTVANVLREREELAGVGGLAYLSQIVDATPRIASVEEHARIVFDIWRKRRFIAICQRFASEGYGDVGDAQAWFDAAREEFEGVRTGPGGARWKRIQGADIFAPLPAIPWLCEHLGIAPGPPTMFAGYGYSGKTVCLQSLAVAVAYGLEAWGGLHVRSGRVVHIDHEQGEYLTRLRYQRLLRAADLDFPSSSTSSDHFPGFPGIREEFGDRLSLVVFPRTYLDSDGAEDEYVRELDGHTLAIIDSLRAAAPGTDENDSTARRPLDMLARVSERTGCAIIVIHHARKPQRDAPGGAKMSIRGSGAIFDACQTVCVLGKDEGEDPRLELEKERITGRVVEPMALRIEDVQGPSGARWGLRVIAEGAGDAKKRAAQAEFDELCTAVLDLVRKNPGSPTQLVSELLRALGKGTRYQGVLAALELLKRNGAVRDEKGARAKVSWYPVLRGCHDETDGEGA